MAAFVPTQIKKHKARLGEVTLTLTSMMDMFTIILVFLMKTYATEGQMIQPSDYLTLPKSTSEGSPEVALDVVVSKEWVMVNHEPVAPINQITAQKGLIIGALLDKLSVYAREAKRMEEMYGKKFSGQVTIQGDRNIPYKVLVKIIATCGKSEFPNMRLAVYQQSAG